MRALRVLWRTVTPSDLPMQHAQGMQCLAGMQACLACFLGAGRVLSHLGMGWQWRS